MTWAIVVLLGLVLFMLVEIGQRLGRMDHRLTALDAISSAAQDYERERRGLRVLDSEYDASEKEGLPAVEAERHRAWAKEQIASTWGGWRKATLTCRRSFTDIWAQEYVFAAADRTYRVRGGLPQDEERGLKVGAEVEYAVDPNRRSLYLPSSSRGVAQFEIYEENVQEIDLQQTHLGVIAESLKVLTEMLNNIESTAERVRLVRDRMKSQDEAEQSRRVRSEADQEAAGAWERAARAEADRIGRNRKP